MVELNLCFIGDKLPAGATYSYLQESTGKSSLIDNFIVSETLVADIKKLDITESGINLSDHLPVIMELNLPIDDRECSHGESVNKQTNSLRWDRADLFQYYRNTYNNLSNIKVPTHLCN